jgi:ribokinase
MRVAVVGHVEWIEFARVDRVPGRGDIEHATEWWEEPGGGGAVAASQLARLAGESSFFTALGDDETGRRAARELADLGLRVEAAIRPEPTRRAVTFLDPSGERTITTLGERLHPTASDPLPWDELAAFDAVYFTAGDAEALRLARHARVLVATSRSLETVLEAGVALDALIGSARDPAESFEPSGLPIPVRLSVLTEGADGGWFVEGGARGRYAAIEPPGPVADAYGAGDSFHAGLTFGLAAGLDSARALRLAARCGAAAASGRGAHPGQVRADGIAD